MIWIIDRKGLVEMTTSDTFSYITPEEQERMRICFDMHEAVYRNNETVMEYSSSMKK